MIESGQVVKRCPVFIANNIRVMLCVVMITLGLGFGVGCQQAVMNMGDGVEAPSIRELRLIQEDEFRRLGLPGNAFHMQCGSYDVLIDALGKEKGIESDPEVLKKDCSEMMDRKLLTPYENPVAYDILLRRSQMIEEVIAHDRLPKKPLILGTAPIGSLNAREQWNPIDGRYVVVYDGGLFTFQYLLSKAIALALPVKEDPDGFVTFSTAKEDIVRHLNSDPSAVERFGELLDSYVRFGHPEFASRYILPFPRNRSARTFVLATELFVVGHEYGHVLLDQTLKERNTSLKSLTQKLDLRSSVQVEEFLADEIGLTLTAAALENQKYGSHFALTGATIQFKADEILWKALSVSRVGQEEPYPLDGTHPPPGLRIMRLRQIMKDEFGPETPEAESWIKLSETIEWVMETLWSRNRASFSQLYEKKIRPHSLWDNAKPPPKLQLH